MKGARSLTYDRPVSVSQPEQQAPPVQRLRIRYAKRGRLRFTSHRDFSRAFERAVFRARVPMAYSSGFNPHPRISYAGAAPTGCGQRGGVPRDRPRRGRRPGRVQRALDEALPDGLDVLEVVESPGGSLADLLEASRWLIDLPRRRPRRGERRSPAFLATEAVLVERMTKKGLRTFDCRAAVVALTRPSATRACRARPGAAPHRARRAARRRAHRPAEVAGLEPRRAAADPARPGAARRGDGTVGDPLRASR